MSGLRRSISAARDEVSRRRYRRRAARLTGSDRFESLGPGSIIHPPALIIGHERISIGTGVVLHPGAFLSVVGEHGGVRYEASMTIGDRVSIGHDVVIACAGSIDIGDDVLAADRVFIGDTSHDYRDASRPVGGQGLRPAQPVAIGSGSFLGIGCAILPGVTLGQGVYVGANAVVTHDVEPHTVVVGNPSRPIRRWDGSEWVKL